MATEFVVRGSHRVFHSPERATVRVTIALEGPAPQPVYDGVVRELQGVRTSIEELHDPGQGPVTWWSTGQVRTWAQRPWNQDGKQLPLVHHASVGVRAKFSDFAVLSRWVGQQVSSSTGFSLDGVVWALTEQNRLQLERAVRARAVRAAAERAQEYADALGLGKVQPVAVADSGMLGQGLTPSGDNAASFSRMAAGKQGGGELELSPEDIEISAEVDARFAAR